MANMALSLWPGNNLSVVRYGSPTPLSFVNLLSSRGIVEIADNKKTGKRRAFRVINFSCVWDELKIKVRFDTNGTGAEIGFIGVGEIVTDLTKTKAH